MKKVYLASSLNEEYRNNAEKAKEILEKNGLEVYYPLNHTIPNAWDYPNHEWGLMVFTNDIEAIQTSDVVVALSYGRVGTAGVNWEIGFAYGIGKPVILVYMTDDVQSLMVANGRYATLKGLENLENYIKETNRFTHLIKARVNDVEQK